MQTKEKKKKEEFKTEEFLKKTGWTSIITSVITALIGISIIGNPGVIMHVVAYILGVVFMVFGVVKLVSYFVAKGTYDFYNYEMIFGILAMIIGIVTIVYRETIATIFQIIIGIWILYSGFMRLGLVSKLKSLNLKEWKWALVVAILILICGLYVIFNRSAIGIAIGVAILIYSIMDIVEGVIFLRNVDSIF